MDEIDLKMSCNDTCCSLSHGTPFCFIDHNFTDNGILTYPEDWEIGVRWSVTIPLVFMGFFGNFITIFLLYKNRLLMRSSVNHFILNMAMADLILSLAGPIPFTIRCLHQFWVLGEFWCYMDGYIQVMVMLVSVTSLATISIDRMLGVFRPLHTHLTTKYAWYIVITIWVYAFFMATPFGIYRIYRERQWKDFKEITCTENMEKTKIWWIIDNIALVWLPLFILLFSNSIIIYSFKKFAMKVRGKEHPAMIHMKKRVIKMIFVIVLLFIIMWIPFQIYIHFFYSSSDSNDYKYGLAFSITQYLIYVNPAVNPIVYALMHQNFQRAYRSTCSCCFKTKPKFFLSKGQGDRPFVWSMSGVSDTYNVIIRSIRRKPRNESRARLDTGRPSPVLKQPSNNLMVPTFDDMPQPEVVPVYNNTDTRHLLIYPEEVAKTLTQEESKKKNTITNTASMISEVCECEHSDRDSERVL